MSDAADAAKAKTRTTTYVEREFLLVKSMPASYGVGTGSEETVADPRDGQMIRREKLAFLSRRHCRLIEGDDREGGVIKLEVPTWLLERQGLE